MNNFTHSRHKNGCNSYIESAILHSMHHFVTSVGNSTRRNCVALFNPIANMGRNTIAQLHDEKIKEWQN